ncbi:MAG: murein L,D-transpeptidase catalytic domain family protein [Sphingobacteriales bacterium]|nr:murein L,D-transpeptidase catalytic domain family protein [Sphingobacteriales bacterium]
MSFTPLPEAGTIASGNSASAKANPETFSLYNSIRLDQYGLSEEAFIYALKGYEKLASQNRISRCDYLTICDFSQSSRHKRLYIIDMTKGLLLFNTYVAHGRNSGGEFARKFSNTPESLQSSLGFYITSNTYIGEHGLSLRINGLESGYNDKAFERSIVIHGAAYVDGSRAKSAFGMGRSFGCPAVPQKESGKIINTIKNGTCFFIYHPSRNYLLTSKILND